MGDPAGNDGGHVWLRQSVTGTIDGRIRTMEIAIPVRPGMAADQIEALLREADVCMPVISRHLDSYFGESASPTPPSSGMSPELPTVALYPSSSEPVRASSRGERPVAVPARPVAAPKPAPSAVSPTEPAEPAEPAQALSVRDFVAAARAELDLSPKQAMERLNVKSLTSLDLREALAKLRSQSLPSAGNVANSTNSFGGGPSSALAAAPSPPLPPPLPRYFEEEDNEFEVTFSLDGDLPEEIADLADPLFPKTTDEKDEFDLEDVPDFDIVPPSQVAAPATKRPAAPKPSAFRAAAEDSLVASLPKETTMDAGRSQALQIIGQLRATSKGGVPSSQQRIAYRNIILQELGEQTAKTLVTSLWRVPVERLGAEQLDALLSWGKRETFGGEASLVLAALRAERQRGAA
ncbi:MAG: hypothetical protein ACLQUY_13210, partial [Ktedonobacterales bacterium]